MATIQTVQRVSKNDTLERRRRYSVRWTGAKAERSKQLTKWGKLADNILPERGRFLTTDHNKPKDTSQILNNVPTRVARALAAGFMSYMTSPTRPWMNITLPDPLLAQRGPVRAWLYRYNQRMRQALDLSGFYKAMAMGVYPDLVTFGTAACLMEEDPIKLFRFIPLAMGSYGLAQNGRGQVDSILYEEAWTVGELVKEFGWENVSEYVRTQWNTGLYESSISVLRVISPNSEFIPGMLGKRGMRWGSAWMEMGGDGSSTGMLGPQSSTDPDLGFLRDEGYEDFPGLCPRWATTSRDVYGTGPGHDALPDCRQLMQLEKRALLALAKGVNPPMLIPSSMRMQRLTMLPGDPVYLPEGMGTQKIEPAQVVDVRWLEAAENKIRQTEQRIGQAFFAELMLMFTDQRPDGGKQPVTAQEIAAKQSEKMLMLGPVLENLNEMLAHMIDRAAGIMERRGLIDPPPREIQGMGLKVEFISVMAQAQKLVGTSAKDRLLQFAGQLAQLKPEVTAKIDAFKMFDSYADDLGTPPDVVLDDEVAQGIIDAQRAKQEAQEQGAAMLAATQGAKNLATPAGEGSLLSKLTEPTQAGGEA